eukprot:4573091-Pyramimonas_sp.AAC.1
MCHFKHSVELLVATRHVRGVPTWVAGTHANAATGGCGGAPYVACLLYTSDAADDTPCVDL